MGKVIYIEGTQDLDNGDLRKAFSKLFEKELKGNMPRIVMGNGKIQTIDKFQSTPLSPGEQRYLLVDSDDYITNKTKICQEYNDNKQHIRQECNKNNTFLMIQEAEAWILSQPEILEKNKIKINKLPQKDVMQIAKPSDLMTLIYRDSGKEYHKVREFCRIFPKLDTAALKAYFSEFRDFIDILKK